MNALYELSDLRQSQKLTSVSPSKGISQLDCLVETMTQLNSSDR